MPTFPTFTSNHNHKLANSSISPESNPIYIQIKHKTPNLITTLNPTIPSKKTKKPKQPTKPLNPSKPKPKSKHW